MRKPLKEFVQLTRRQLKRCHGISKSFAPLCNCEREPPRRKAVASQRVLRLFCSREREPPRRKAVASPRFSRLFVAANVNLHGARPWHLQEFLRLFCSREREPPRRKAVASASLILF